MQNVGWRSQNPLLVMVAVWYAEQGGVPVGTSDAGLGQVEGTHDPAWPDHLSGRGGLLVRYGRERKWCAMNGPQCVPGLVADLLDPRPGGCSQDRVST